MNSNFYFCHYCEETSEIADKEKNGMLWRCPVCGFYNDTEAIEEGENDPRSSD